MSSSPSSPPILLDLDGTLVDTLADIGASANHVRTAFGLDAAPLPQVRTWIGDGVAALIDRCLADLDRTAAPRDKALELYREHHLVQCTALARPYPGVVEHIERWRAEQRPLAVVTNKPTLFTERILEHTGLSTHIPVAICGDTLAVKKPDPEPLHEALRRLGAEPGNGLMVGDGVQDLRAGRAAGLRTAAALFGFTDAARLRAEGADEYWIAFGIQE